MIITSDFINIVFPKHNKKSCSDNNPCNYYVNEDHRIPDCNRCFLMDNIDLELPEGYGLTIVFNPTAKQIKEQALSKLTTEEKRVLGL